MRHECQSGEWLTELMMSPGKASTWLEISRMVYHGCRLAICFLYIVASILSVSKFPTNEVR